VIGWIASLLPAVVVTIRAPAAWRHPGQRRLWWCYATFGLGLAFTRPPVERWVNGIGLGIGIPNLVHPVKHLLGVAATTALLAFVPDLLDRVELASVRRFRRVGYVAGAGTATAMIALFALASPVPAMLVPGELTWLTGYWLAFLGYGFAGLLTGAVVFGRHLRHAAGRPWTLRASIAALSGGCASLLVYVVCRAALLLAPARIVLAAVLDLSLYVGVLLLAVGAAPAAARAVRQRVGEYRALYRLSGLWRELTAATPQVVLRAGLTGRVGELLNPTHLTARLHRRIIEIRDSMLVLRDHAHPELLAAARAHTDRLGLTPEAAEAMFTACWLALAVRQRQTGGDLGPVDVATILAGQSPIDATVAAEVRSLAAVARASRSPAVRSLWTPPRSVGTGQGRRERRALSLVRHRHITCYSV
jgi:hypothetical protein